jgi:hypothetical protein
MSYLHKMMPVNGRDQHAASDRDGRSASRFGRSVPRESAKIACSMGDRVGAQGRYEHQGEGKITWLC